MKITKNQYIIAGAALVGLVSVGAYMHHNKKTKKAATLSNSAGNTVTATTSPYEGKIVNIPGTIVALVEKGVKKPFVTTEEWIAYYNARTNPTTGINSLDGNIIEVTQEEYDKIPS